MQHPDRAYVRKGPKSTAFPAASDGVRASYKRSNESRCSSDCGAGNGSTVRRAALPFVIIVTEWTLLSSLVRGKAVMRCPGLFQP